MDRFIETQISHRGARGRNLKSNMDRFIDSIVNTFSFGTPLFKIQYGQIYRILILN